MNRNVIHFDKLLTLEHQTLALNAPSFIALRDLVQVAYSTLMGALGMTAMSASGCSEVSCSSLATYDASGEIEPTPSSEDSGIGNAVLQWVLFWLMGALQLGTYAFYSRFQSTFPLLRHLTTPYRSGMRIFARQHTHPPSVCSTARAQHVRALTCMLVPRSLKAESRSASTTARCARRSPARLSGWCCCLSIHSPTSSSSRCRSRPASRACSCSSRRAPPPSPSTSS